jgi:hypothetical protein
LISDIYFILIFVHILFEKCFLLLLGRLVVEKLKAKVAAESIVALVRTPEKAADP